MDTAVGHALTDLPRKLLTPFVRRSFPICRDFPLFRHRRRSRLQDPIYRSATINMGQAVEMSTKMIVVDASTDLLRKQLTILIGRPYPIYTNRRFLIAMPLGEGTANSIASSEAAPYIFGTKGTDTRDDSSRSGPLGDATDCISWWRLVRRPLYTRRIPVGRPFPLHRVPLPSPHLAQPRALWVPR